MILTSFRKYALIPMLSLALLGLPQAAGAVKAAGTASTAEAGTIIQLGSTETSSDLQALQEVLDYLEAYNIEGVERQEFLDNAIRGMVYSLDDPYSDYFSKEDLQDFENGVNQEFVGIGVTLRFYNDKLYITDVLPNSPASKAGLQAGDIITKVDGQSVTSSEDVARIQGRRTPRSRSRLTGPDKLWFIRLREPISRCLRLPDRSFLRVRSVTSRSPPSLIRRTRNSYKS